ncbi:PH domain-containing protein [Candidatus Peregrinibacteria bacterium]|nr:PH domain-containing protein [Candidatus Peregrinibacteria bacterium]
MHLREGEQILKIYRHHPTPFVYHLFVAILGTLPFFLVLFLFKESFDTKSFVIAHIVILLAFALVVTYMSLVYWLDKLVITNQRIVFVDWKFLTVKDEAEAFFREIQEIQTTEKGFLSHFRIFDYGSIIIETASAHVDIEFPNAPDPEDIRRFIYHIRTP